MSRHSNGQPEPDLYQMLGVGRQATPAEITQAWRRRARAEHPDARPLDADAPARFRALASAYALLSDPRRRAAYDLGTRVPEPPPRERRPAAATAIRVTVVSTPGSPPAAAPMAHGAPLRAGPVRIDQLGAAPGRGADAHERARLVLLAQMAARWLDGARERPW